MPPLYPKMRERPEEVRVNTAWPYFPWLNTLWVPTARSHLGEKLDTNGPVIGTQQDTRVETLWEPSLNRLSIRDASGTSIIGAQGRSYYLGAPFTMMAWMYVEGSWSGTDWRHPRIFAQSIGSSPYSGRDIFLWATSTRLHLQYAQNSSGYVVNGPVCPTDGWHHIVHAFDGTNIYGIRLYIDGVNQSWTIAVNNPLQNTWISHTIGIFRRWSTPSSEMLSKPGRMCDGIIIDTLISRDHISELSDPSNTDLRVGGVPLLLPPRRLLWPVSTVHEAVYLKRRNLGLRVGTREALV